MILYGATAGEVFIRGQVGERFCVRNSGATAVVEGVGDHGCEYMTGGRVVVLGPTGRNFAAGMSGGVAYVYDPARTFGQRVNLDEVDVEPLDADDSVLVHELVQRHRVETDSAVAERLLENWDAEVPEFVKVMPRDYRRILEATRLAEAEGRSVEEAVMEAAMGKPTGFMEFGRALPRRRPVSVRLRDWREVYEPFGEEATKVQGARCMDCGIPFCHEGCPLGNLIPEWNDLVYRDDWPDAIERLHATNNFPEFTGRLCPAPCEAVVRARDQRGPGDHRAHRVRDRRAGLGRGVGHPAARRRVRTGKTVAVVGSGPAGLAAAQQLARAGHTVTVFERAEKPGGLLRYGIPEFKMEKAVLDRRLAQMEAEGVTFVCSTSVGGQGTRPPTAVLEPGEERGLGTACAPDVAVRRRPTCGPSSTRVVLAGGATLPRDLPVPGRELAGVHLALEYLKPSNLVQERRAGGLAHQRATASGSSSSAAATPGPTAWARHTARARPRCTSSRSWPSPRATGRPRTRGRCGR